MAHNARPFHINRHLFRNLLQIFAPPDRLHPICDSRGVDEADERVGVGVRGGGVEGEHEEEGAEEGEGGGRRAGHGPFRDEARRGEGERRASGEEVSASLNQLQRVWFTHFQVGGGGGFETGVKRVIEAIGRRRFGSLVPHQGNSEDRSL